MLSDVLGVSLVNHKILKKAKYLKCLKYLKYLKYSKYFEYFEYLKYSKYKVFEKVTQSWWSPQMFLACRWWMMNPTFIALPNQLTWLISKLDARQQTLFHTNINTYVQNTNTKNIKHKLKDKYKYSEYFCTVIYRWEVSHSALQMKTPLIDF